MQNLASRRAEIVEFFPPRRFRSARDSGITGRSKEIINRGGKKFFPREVEEILYTHPGVMHAAMIGMPDPRFGERNCLCVVPKGDKAPTLEEFVAFLRDQVADYKLPESVEEFSELPMTGSGKIQRHVLRDLVMKRREIASR